jgi:Mg-chelatase subunit ChlD
MLRRILVAAAAVVVAAVITVGLSRSDAAAAEPVSPDDMHRALGIDRVAADYVILVDISGSMQGARYAELKAGLRTFLASVAPQDQVSVVTFANDARTVGQGEAGRAPGLVVDQLPADATGTATDIGRALESAVAILSRDGAPTIGTVVLLTDGAHEPPPGSPYPFESGYAWDELRRSADRLDKDVLTAFAVPLSGSTGAHLLAKVFPAATVLETDAIDHLTTQLEQPKRVVQAAKTRQMLSSELNGGLAVEWPTEPFGAGTTTMTVLLRSTTAHIPIEVTGLTVTADNPAVVARPDQSSVTVGPGEAVPVHLVLSWDTGPRSWKPVSTTTVHSRLTLQAKIGSPWADALEADGVTFDPVLSGGQHDATGTAGNGRPGAWVAAAVALLGLLIVGRLAAARRLRPNLRGTLTVDPPVASHPALRLQGREATISNMTLGIPGLGTVVRRRQRVLARESRLHIAYSRDGLPDHREHGDVGPDEPASIGGVTFRWRDA